MLQVHFGPIILLIISIKFKHRMTDIAPKFIILKVSSKMSVSLKKA